MWILILTMYAGSGNVLDRSHITAEFNTKQSCELGAKEHIRAFKQSLDIFQLTPTIVTTCVSK